MKTIEVRDQVHLPMIRCVNLVMRGLKYRLFRASITVLIIALAGAFLMTMLSEGLIARQVADVIKVQTAPRNKFLFWVARLSTPLTPLNLSNELGAISSGDNRWQEFAAWGNLTDQELQQLTSVARQQRVYLTYFEADLDEGQRRLLAGPARNEAIFAYLHESNNWNAFRENLKTSSRQLPNSLADFEQFLKDWNNTDPLCQRILQGNAAAVKQVKATILKGKSPQQLLAKADENLAEQLQPLGFRMPKKDIPLLREQAQADLDAKKILELFMSEPANRPIAPKPAAETSPAAQPEPKTPDESAKSAASGPAELPASEAPANEAPPTKRPPRQPMRQAAPRQSQSLRKLSNLKAGLLPRRQPPRARPPKKRPRRSNWSRKPKNLPKRRKPRRAVTRVLVKNLLATRIGENIAKVTEQMLYEELSTTKGAEWYAEVTSSEKRFGLSPARIKEIASNVLDQTKLAAVEASIVQVATGKVEQESAGQPAKKVGLMGFNSRTIALIIVSFLVCVVGIANAMLMSVTERFREIATMKCLGATDGFIMINFILESIMQGITGGTIGVVVGFLLGTLRAWASYGWLAMANFPTGSVASAAVLAVAVSIVISTLAAVYPAWVAARLAPMEAMRIE